MSSLDGRRPLWVPLLAWLVTAALAVNAMRANVALAGLIALAGGMLFGWLSARCEDARPIRVRRRRVASRRSEVGAADDDDELGGDPAQRGRGPSARQGEDALP